MDSSGKSPTAVAKLQDLVDTSEDVRKLIECPVCLELPLPPIYLCRRGHIVCSSCQNKTSSCPLCRDCYSTCRSFVAEGIVEKLTLPCKYKDDGCKTTLFGCDLGEHVKTCEYRPLKCFHCTGVQGHWVSFPDFFNHLVSKHNISGVCKTEVNVVYNMDKDDINGSRANVSRYCWAPYYLKGFDDKVFLVRVHGNVSYICIWVSLIGTQEMCRNYEAEIEFKVDGEKGFNLTWRGQVACIRDDPTADVIFNGRGLMLPLDIILLASKTPSKYVEWSYSIRIHEKSTEKAELAAEEKLTSEKYDAKESTKCAPKDSDSGKLEE